MTPYEWRQQLFSCIGIENADGRPLYQYRISQQKFDNVREILKLSSLMGTREVLGMRDWDACFVMFAAEWWRRHYKGNWGWDEVFSYVNLDQASITVYQRNDLIQSGLRKWRREIRISHDGSRQFLGTVATEGGLPMHQLSASGSGGWLHRTLRPVLKKHLSKKIPVESLLNNCKDLIPKSYRSDEVLSILEDIVTAIAALKGKYQLDEHEEPVNWLDKNEPLWRAQFPLPLENDVASSLLNDLVITASREKAEESNYVASYEYSLVQAESNKPQLLLQINLNQYLEIDNVQEKIKIGELPSLCSVEVDCSNLGVLLRLRGLRTVFKTKEVYRLQGRTGISLTGFEATGIIKWSLIFAGRVVYSEVVTEGLLTENLSPWTFRDVDNNWIFAGSATCKISSENAMLYIPTQLDYEIVGGDTNLSGLGDFLDGRIYKLKGTVKCRSGKESFKITTNCHENSERLLLDGQMLTDHPIVQKSIPSLVYIGQPNLIEKSLIAGNVSKRSFNLIAKAVGYSNKSHKILTSTVGVYDLSYLDEDHNIVYKKRIGLLAGDFDIKLQPIDQDTGKVHLKGTSGLEVLVSTDNVKSHIEKNDSGYILTMHYEGEDSPHNIDLTLYQNSSKEITITVPFPARGAFLFNPSGNRIDVSTPLHLEDLVGHRLRVFEPQSTRLRAAELEFQLDDRELSHFSLKELYIREKLEIDNQNIEFSLYDWADYVESLLKISSNPDATVKVSFISRGHSYFQLTVRRFASLVERSFSDGVLALSDRARRRYSSHEIAGMEVKALYLQQPAQNYTPLVQKVSEGVPLGQWLVEPDSRAHGSWIFYPSNSSTINFRPVVWPVGEYSPSIHDATTLEKATAVPDTAQRLDAIRLVLNQMALNSKHGSWLYISDLWDKTLHLPLTTFDIWKVGSTEPDFLVALFLKGQNKVLEKVEQELPMLWELVPFDSWLDAFIRWKQDKQRIIGDDPILDELLKNKINSLTDLSSSMQATKKLLMLELLKLDIPELKVIDLILPEILSDARKELLRQPDSSRWPVHFEDHLTKYFESSNFASISELRAPNNFKNSVMYLPAALAEQMASGQSFTGEQLTAIDVFKIKQIKQFSPSWFDNTFQILSVWLYKQLLQERNSR